VNPAALSGEWPALLGERLSQTCEAEVAFTESDCVLSDGAWCRATLTVDGDDWDISFGLDRAVAIAMGGAMMALKPIAVADLVANSRDSALMIDAFNEIANLAFAAMDDVLRGVLGDGVHTVRQDARLTTPAPGGEAVVCCEVQVGEIGGRMALRMKAA